jgi:hypothetical protein
VAEESGKGIALVILGIVAIIAIVGLVLLFTGMKKATGEFAVPAAKEYGGAIRGVYTPYDRAFTGRALDYPSGQRGVYAGQGSIPNKVAWEVTGEDPYTKTIDSTRQLSYNRGFSEIPSVIACQWLDFLTGDRGYETAADVGEATAYMAQGKGCIDMDNLNAVDLQVQASYYGLSAENVQSMLSESQADGAAYCCQNPGLTGTI